MATTKPDAHRLAVGAAGFKFEAVRSAKLPFQAEVQCVSCGRIGTIRLGQITATFRVGRELVGVCCDDCLTPESRAALTQMRQAAVTGK